MEGAACLPPLQPNQIQMEYKNGRSHGLAGGSWHVNGCFLFVLGNTPITYHLFVIDDKWASLLWQPTVWCPKITAAHQAAPVKARSPVDEWNCWGVVFSLCIRICGKHHYRQEPCTCVYKHPLIPEVVFKWPQLKLHEPTHLSITICWNRCGSFVYFTAALFVFM